MFPVSSSRLADFERAAGQVGRLADCLGWPGLSLALQVDPLEHRHPIGGWR
jgi:hypothetical protein